MKIRPFRPADGTRVAGLYESSFRSGSTTAANDLSKYFIRIFTDPATTDAATPSLVLVDEDDLPVGFLGVQYRKFQFAGKDVCILVTGPYIVAPDARRGGAGLFLLQRVRRYQCDLMLTDGANIAARDIWLALRGQQHEDGSRRFALPFKPLRFVLERNGFSQRTRWHRILCILTGPLVKMADLLTRRTAASRTAKGRSAQPTQPLTALAMQQIDTILAAAHPHYLNHAGSLNYRQWQLTELGKLCSRGELRAELVLNSPAEPVGWFVYFRRSDSTSDVVQLAAQPGYESTVLAALCVDAHTSGTSGLKGRLQAEFEPALAELNATFHPNRLLTLIYTRVPQLADAFIRGRTTFSWLDGEAWLGFANEFFGSANEDSVTRN